MRWVLLTMNRVVILLYSAIPPNLPQQSGATSAHFLNSSIYVWIFVHSFRVLHNISYHYKSNVHVLTGVTLMHVSFRVITQWACKFIMNNIVLKMHNLSTFVITEFISHLNLYLFSHINDKNIHELKIRTYRQLYKIPVVTNIITLY